MCQWGVDLPHLGIDTKDNIDCDGEIDAHLCDNLLYDGFCDLYFLGSQGTFPSQSISNNK